MDRRADTEREYRLWEQANAHFGLLRFEDLRAGGLSPSAITGRLGTRRLTHVHDRVYALGHQALRDEGWWLGAQWTVGDGAVLTHLTAAAYHGWLSWEPGDAVHVSTTRSVKSRAGITVHRVRHLVARDVFRPHPLAVTTMPRTLVDLADVLPWAEYRALADALPQLRVDQIRAAQRRAPGRRGAARVTRLIQADDAHTKSEFERRFIRFLGAHGLPRPDALNQNVAGHKVDVIYTAARLVVELDGRAYHQRRAQMRADRHRDTDVQLAGFRVLRLVWDDLHPVSAARTSDRLARFLACVPSTSP
jgi:very-short-patch-repair endonuclease